MAVISLIVCAFEMIGTVYTINIGSLDSKSRGRSAYRNELSVDVKNTCKGFQLSWLSLSIKLVKCYLSVSVSVRVGL